MKTILTILSLVLLLTACAANDAPAPVGLAGTQWVLKAMPGWEMAKAPQVPTLSFQSDTSVGGRSGCNSWGGGYEIKGNTIRFGHMRVTMMACAYGMDAEQRYLQMIEQTRAFAVNGDTLILSDEHGTEHARFFRASTATPPKP
jgi:heat shock protein HslJ